MQHSESGGSWAAPISLMAPKAFGVLRWTIQTWSLESTATPIAGPRIQWFGSGLGQNGSTSKRGAIKPSPAASPASEPP